MFGAVGMPVVDWVLAGFNACLLAVGDSGAGKSYTLFGTHEEPGLSLRIMEAMFARLARLADRRSITVLVQ